MNPTNGRFWIGAGAMVAALVLTGCHKTVRVEEWRLEPPPPSLQIAGPAVDVQNFRGRVEVRVVPREPDINIEAKVVAEGDPPRETLAAITDAVSVQTELEDAEGPILHVRTASALPGADHAVNLVITLPACAGVRVRTSGDEVQLVGVQGAIHVETSDGAIEVRTAQPITDPVALVTTRGNIYYQVPPGSTGRFEVEALDGEVRWEGFEPGVVNTAPLTVVSGRYTTTLNGGENPVLIRTGRGVVRVAITPSAERRIRAVR